MRFDGQIGHADVLTRIDEYLLPDVDTATALFIRPVELFDEVDTVAFIPPTHEFVCGGFGNIYRPTVRRFCTVSWLRRKRLKVIEVVGFGDRRISVMKVNFTIHLVWCRAMQV